MAREVITLSRFFDLEGNKRSFITEDIIDQKEGSLAEFIQNTNTKLRDMGKNISEKSAIVIANDISERDTLGKKAGMIVWVKDATADSTVKSGGAAYISVEREGKIAWDKMTESESMDVTLAWEAIIGKPTSAVSEIDDAVTKRHSHANKTLLDSITTQDGYLSFDNVTLNGCTGIDQRSEISQVGNFKSKMRIVVEQIEIESE